MIRPRIFVELCAGTGAVSLRLTGGAHSDPVTGYQGNKRCYAHSILAVLGLRQGLGCDEVWLNDAGDWGWIWRVLSQDGAKDDVAQTIASWGDDDAWEPRPLWDALKVRGWADMSSPADVAAWLVCQHWSFSGKGVASGYGGPGSVVNAPDANWTTEQRDRALGLPRLSRLVTELNVPSSLTAFHGPAQDVPIPEDCNGVVVYIDPDYKGTTGYQHTFPRDEVIGCARVWDEAGATVCISEAEPIDLPWAHVEITSERKGNGRTWSKQKREWLTLNRVPAWRPSVQEGLFCGGGG